MAVNESLFLDLARTGYRVTSPTDVVYNCVAWAVGQTSAWWWPDPAGFDFWPATLPRAETVDAFAKLFRSLGYVPCNEDGLEVDWEKVALYALKGVPTHATRQLSNGHWTSKLGPDEDIEHELHALAGSTYGI